METLYHQTNHLLQQVHGDLANLERALGTSDVHQKENELQVHIDRIFSNCERLDILVMKEPVARRANAKMRVDQLKYDCQHLQSSMRQLQHKRYMKEQEEYERESLLSRKFTTNEQDTAITIDPALQHHTKLNESSRQMDNLLGHGGSILTSLRDQRVTLKGAHRRLLDITNTLGLTNTVMRLIEKRTSQDKIIMVVCMLICCLVMYLVWKYFT
ncbi:Golgi SNAP receptor complex member 2 [Biomphalaria pfeifferi]|uniref:Golgi SNAP receptor complex member 2 n=1 Tax=Biomphalaria pfeifferi TaxID=112525 RepID=A0AAD8B052_BIOPF|nr:Golgi SNAP receptor complex member 2 [Biomphalaria pfeifferi]